MEKRNMVIIVDMVKGFVDFGNLADKNINRIVPAVVALTKHGLRNGDLVVAFKDTHSPNDEEFKSYPAHCIKGSEECQLIDALKPYENQMVVIEKPTTNGFDTEMFKQILQRFDFDEIEICGCCTDICVANLVDSLQCYIQYTGKSTSINVIANAVDTFNAPNHNADKVNTQYLNKFAKLPQTKVSILDLEACEKEKLDETIDQTGTNIQR